MGGEKPILFNYDLVCVGCQLSRLETLHNSWLRCITRPCGTGIHYAMRAVKDMGQQMGYHSLEWNWPKEAMNIPI